MVPGGPGPRRGRRRDPDRRQRQRPHRPSGRWRQERVFCARRSGGSAAPTSMPCRSSGASTCSWATPTAPTTSGSSRRSSRSFARATSTSWDRGGRARSSRAPCQRFTGTSGHRSPPGSSTGSTRASFSDIHCGMRGITTDALRAHGPAVTVVGVRVRDGAQVRAHGPADDGGAGPLPEGSGGTPQPPQAGRLVLTLPGCVDQPSGDVRLRGRLLPRASRASFCSRSVCCSTLPLSFGPITIGSVTLSVYWMLLGMTLAVRRDFRASSWARSRPSSTTTAARIAIVCSGSSRTTEPWRSPPFSSSWACCRPSRW